MAIQANHSSVCSQRHPLQIGLLLPHYERQMDGRTPRWTDISTMAQRAEEVGFDSVWVTDHLLFRFGQRFGLRIEVGSWECWSMVAALAATTRRVEIGTLVACTSFRSPALLAKMADTVEEISRGRLILGLGAGYHEPEYRAFGYPYDHRVGRFEEALTIITTLLRTGRIDFTGEYYEARECELRPRGPRPAGPPIMVGGRGQRVVRLTAQQADMWNGWLVWGRSRADEVPPLRAVVDAACREVGRDPTTLQRTMAILVAPRGSGSAAFGRLQRMILGRVGLSPVPLTGSPEELDDSLQAFAHEGITHVQVSLQESSVAAVEAFGPVLKVLQHA